MVSRLALSPLWVSFQNPWEVGCSGGREGKNELGVGVSQSQWCSVISHGLKSVES